MRDNVQWTHLLGLRFRLFRPFRNVLESIVNNGKTLGMGWVAWIAYSRCGRIKVLYRGRKILGVRAATYTNK